MEWSESNVRNTIVDKPSACRKYNEWNEKI